MEILPSDQKYWQFLTSAIEDRARALGFARIDTPIVSPFDIIEKIPSIDPSFSLDQLTYLNSVDGISTQVLQPDATANILNAYNQYLNDETSYLSKLYRIGGAYFGNGPQYLNLFNAELIGDDNPASDALLILLAWQIIKNFHLQDSIEIQLNSIGCPTCRAAVNKELENFYVDNQSALCPTCGALEKKDILKTSNCHSLECQATKKEAPAIVDVICSECKNHLTGLLEHLDDLEIPYTLTPNLYHHHPVAGRTIFDITSTEDNRIYGRGNRHDRAIELIGGIARPAVGMQLKLDSIMEKVKENENVPLQKLDIYLIQLGAQAKKKILPIAARLVDKGFFTSCALHKDTLKTHLLEAEQAGAKIGLIMGQREAIDNTIIFRDIEQCSQETINMADLDRFLSRHFKK